LAGGFDLPTTVMPFILRGVALQGIDSVYLPSEKRSAVWQRLGASLTGDQIDSLARDVGLADLLVLAEQMLAGKLKGRAIVVFDAKE
jgi:acrylyl-CoA reductase (NADPH)